MFSLPNFLRGGAVFFTMVLLLGSLRDQGKPKLSEDRDLKEIDLTSWDCLNKLEGSARSPDGVERNRLKNRSATDIAALPLKDLDAAGFLRGVAEFEAQTQGKRRKDLSPAEREKLEPLEKEIVQLTGYLVLVYCGPPETTNCASVDFHDWHLELFEKPSDHPPQPGDPTPIVCEITPRTQNAIYHDNVRIQELTAFFRGPDLTYQATGHKAHKVRVIGYRLWDDEHNGRADVGPTIRTVGANKYHNPWRSAAWEIHPVIKIVPLDGSSPATKTSSVPSAQEASAAPAALSPAEQASPPLPNHAAPIEKTPLPLPTQVPRPQFVTLTQPVNIKIPYGEAVLPRGAKLPVTSFDAKTVTVLYMGGSYVIPVGSTDLPQ